MYPRTLADELRAAAARRGDHVAIVAGERRITYAELDRRVDGFAAGLRELGVQRGDRVAVILRNGIEPAIAIYGVLRAGAVFTPLNPTAKAQRLAQLLAHSGALAAVCSPDIAKTVRAAGARRQGFRHLIVTGEQVSDARSFDELAAYEPVVMGEVLEVDLSAIIYTSGSTGMPKGAVFLHRNMRFVAGSIVEYLGLSEKDRILCVLPLSHTYGLYHLIMSVRLGATLVLEHGIGFPGRIVETLERERITVLPGVPTVWQVLISLRGLAERELPHLRLLTNAGAAVSAAQLGEIRRTFGNAQMFSMYGQTECKRVCYLPPEDLDSRPGSVGVAIPGTEVWIEDEEGHVVGAGEVGELQIRGDHIMLGYWNDPQETARKLRPGRFPGDRVLRSGDLFRRDSDGYLFFVSRMDDIIKSRGEKIAPREVEDVLCVAAGVKEAAVLGVADALLGQAVVAHVAAMEGCALDPLALRRHCAAHLEDYKVPKIVIVHSELPKTDNGKLDKPALRAVGDGHGDFCD